MAFVTRLPPPSMVIAGPSILVRPQSVLAMRIGHRTFTTSVTRRAAPTDKTNPSIGELMNRKSFGDAWRGLSPNQRTAFVTFVLIAGAGEYLLLKKYILDPVKAKKEEEARQKIVAEGEMVVLPGDAV